MIVSQSNARPTRELVLLGASGSIGTTTRQFLKGQPAVRLQAASVHRSLDSLPELIALGIRRLALTDPEVFERNQESILSRYPSLQIYGGEKGMLQMLADARSAGADTVLTAIVGAAGLTATIRSIELDYKIALANKETLVTAGPVIRDLLLSIPEKERPAMLPVDSEHNSLFQLLELVRPEFIRRLILTASGGPFRTTPLAELQQVNRKEVLSHPTWSMGPKITVDSAGMINKGLEVIEAHFLFGRSYEEIEVVIHPQSQIHALLELRDGSYLMAGATPSMLFPIAHALMYPNVLETAHHVARPPVEWPALCFEKVDPLRYPGFDICLNAGHRGGSAPAALNAANEELVAAFLKGEIGFCQIPELLDETLKRVSWFAKGSLADYIEMDRRARSEVQSLLKQEVIA
ncbi:MAG: 1-deoxy-D-xylulose-5-phosphate reductoisomerase [Spirochaetales bacterium]|nr:1-deoxy-D-xylulose-5-phosphate reductoisomerase [Spirochaetales bacterium]